MLEHHYSDYLYGSPEGESLATSKASINKSLLDHNKLAADMEDKLQGVDSFAETFKNLS